ncbi:hybrid sensor histidine kinase/response regulator [Deferribacter abyssi]|uniref:hybrid sensor histidine kinase/response regulator n=1 Tax=Deferribacter abyssi TaxID=213806 RepID=UPI003C291479
MDDKKLFKIFTEELTTHINNIRTFINNFFETEEKEYLTKIVKELHTLKGSSGILGLHNLTDIFHDLENYFQRLTKYDIEDNDKIKIIEIVNLLEKIPKNLENPNNIINEIDKLLKSNVIKEKKYKNNQENIITTKTIAPEKVVSLKTEFQKLNTHIYDLLSNIQIKGFIKNRLLEQLEKIGYQLNRLNLTTFSILDEKLKNIAHLTATKLSKNVKLEIINSNVEVDEEILNITNEILTHIIRNAVYHGIEHPEERLKYGKPKTGKITIQYKQVSDRIHIIITDDGKGINLSSIVEKGVENGLIQPNDIQKLKKEDIYNLLFNENFSTSLEVDEISGRGIGLSIVKERIEEIGGYVEIESEVGKYTKFIINIPFTFKSVVCKILSSAGHYLAVPISIIESIEKFIPENIRTNKDNSSVIEKNGTLFNLYKLSELFKIYSSDDNLLVFFKNTKNVIAVESVGENILFDLVPIKGIQCNYKHFVGFALYNNKPIGILNPSSLSKTTTKGLKTFVQTDNYVNNAKKTILAVDDNPVITETIKELLTNEGYNILIAKNGVEAFELFRNKNIDFIITDIEMPLMDGLTLTRNIRKLNKSVPILILSSKGNEQDIQNGLDAGANGYFIKRFFIKDSFLKKIKELL